jgi:hypothetical protein
MSYTNFHEKAHFVKADVAALIGGRAQRLHVLRAMLPSALLVSLLFGGSVHCEILLFGLPRRRCNLRISLSSRRVDQVRNLRSRLMREIRSDQTQKPYVSLWDRFVGIITSCSLASLCFGFLLPLSRLVSRAVGVAQRLVDLSADPQTV